MNKNEMLYKEAVRNGVSKQEDRFGNSLFNLSSIERVSYDVVNVSGLLDSSNPTLAGYNQGTKIFCLMDKNVSELYGSDFRKYFSYYDIEARFFILDSREQVKTMGTVSEFADFCQENGIRRRDHILCVGGGIVLDVGALAANLLRRSTACIKIPTTLLAVVDAAVGVKTGINFGQSKNYLGTYNAPAVVLYDLALLKTLPPRQIRNGLVEIIKIIALRSAELTLTLERNLEDFFTFPANETVQRLINAAIQFMMQELQPNLQEKELKRIVDFGHEFGHPIEVLTNHELLHGEAVGIGMLISHHLALQKGLLSRSDFDFFTNLHRKLNLPFCHNALSGSALAGELEGIRKHKHGQVNLVALRAPGYPLFIPEVTELEVSQACDFLVAMESELTDSRVGRF